MSVSNSCFCNLKKVAYTTVAKGAVPSLNKVTLFIKTMGNIIKKFIKEFDEDDNV